MSAPPAAQVMAAILTALHNLSEEQLTPVPEACIAAHLHISMKTTHHHLINMERLALVRRAGPRGSDRGWLLANPRSYTPS